MNKLVLRTMKDTMTSLELFEKINELRKMEFDYKVANGLKLGKVEEKNNEYTELRHDTLLAMIRDEFEEEINAQKILVVSYQDNKGELRPMYILTLDEARQLMTRVSKFVRRKVFEYIKFLEEQNQMLRQALWNKQNSEWLQTRQKGKLVRRSETDAIATLILYAKEQGSKNADKMYMIYSKLVNDLVGIDSGMRDIVDFKTLIHIGQLEDLFTSVIIDCMENKMYYKEIYKECKKIGDNFMAFINGDIKMLRA